MVKFKHTGNFEITERMLEHAKNNHIQEILSKYGNIGVEALKEATPKDTGKTSESWKFKISSKKGLIQIEWENTNIVNGVPVAIVLQYGHATRNGGWVEGRDYINPAMQPVFDNMVDQLRKEVVGK